MKCKKIKNDLKTIIRRRKFFCFNIFRIIVVEIKKIEILFYLFVNELSFFYVNRNIIYYTTFEKCIHNFESISKSLKYNKFLCNVSNNYVK